jgi:hypothetical protein
MPAVFRILLLSFFGYACHIDADHGRAAAPDIGRWTADTILRGWDGVAPLAGVAVNDRLLISDAASGRLIWVSPNSGEMVNASGHPWRPTPPSYVLVAGDTAAFAGSMTKKWTRVNLIEGSRSVLEAPLAPWGQAMLGRSAWCGSSVLMAQGSVRLLWQSFIPEQLFGTSLVLFDPVSGIVRARFGPGRGLGVAGPQRTVQRMWQLQPLGCLAGDAWAINLYDGRLWSARNGGETLIPGLRLPGLFEQAPEVNLGHDLVATQDQLEAAAWGPDSTVALVRVRGYRWRDRWQRADAADWLAEHVLEVWTLDGHLQGRTSLPIGMAPTFVTTSPGGRIIVGGMINGRTENPPLLVSYSMH